MPMSAAARTSPVDGVIGPLQQQIETERMQAGDRHARKDKEDALASSRR